MTVYDRTVYEISIMRDVNKIAPQHLSILKNLANILTNPTAQITKHNEITKTLNKCLIKVNSLANGGE